MTRQSTAARPAQERPRGRPRDGAVDEAILAATRSILEESGSGGFSIGEVVARTGVSTATIYRRWPSASDLVMEGIRSLVPEAVDIDSGSLASDLDLFLGHMAGSLLSMKGLYAADLQRRDVALEMRREIVATFVAPRERLLMAILERARARGELAALPAFETCWDYVIGPLHHRLLIRGAGFSAAAREQALQIALAALQLLAPPQVTDEP